MARDIDVSKDSTRYYRACIVLKGWSVPDQIEYIYSGPYPKESTAKGVVSRWKGSTHKFYDGWVESADISWQKVKD